MEIVHYHSVVLGSHIAMSFLLGSRPRCDHIRSRNLYRRCLLEQQSILIVNLLFHFFLRRLSICWSLTSADHPEGVSRNPRVWPLVTCRAFARSFDLCTSNAAASVTISVAFSRCPSATRSGERLPTDLFALPPHALLAPPQLGPY